MDSDALEFRHAEQDGQPLLELRTPRDHYSVSAFGDGRAAFHLVGTVGIVAPSGFQCVAEIIIGYACQILVIYTSPNIQPTYRVGLAFCDTFQYQFHVISVF